MSSIVKCGARTSTNQAQMAVKRFSRIETLKNKWLDAVGEENINHRHKEWFTYFEESCFSITLDVMRLHDNCVPTIFSIEKKYNLEHIIDDLCR